MQRPYHHFLHNLSTPKYRDQRNIFTIAASLDIFQKDPLSATSIRLDLTHCVIGTHTHIRQNAGEESICIHPIHSIPRHSSSNKIDSKQGKMQHSSKTRTRSGSCHCDFHLAHDFLYISPVGDIFSNFLI